jgi:glycosyltransferase involved in cell wall biosynthesis
MKVSVIIPVYNAGKYVREAVESALLQPEVAEVILVEDGSTDDSLSKCKELEREYRRVRLFTHKGGINKGAGMSRNLGINKSKHEFIAFLDADDFYLPNRFLIAKEILEKNSSIDGVYEAIGFYFEEEKLRKRHIVKGGSNLTTVSEENIKPEELFYEMSPIGKKGHFSLDGLVLRKSVMEMGKAEMFTKLPLHEDTAFLIELSSLVLLAPGSLKKPVAMRRVHKGNRITAKRSEREDYNHRIKMWLTVYEWGRRNLEKEKRRILLYKTLKCAASHNLKSREQINFWAIVESFGRLLLLFLSNPFLLLDLHLVRIKDIKQKFNKL